MLILANILSENNCSFIEIIIGNIITILLALLAAFVALLQVKSNIISSSRIRWIDGLSDDISKLYNETLGTVLYFEIYKRDNDDIYYTRYDNAHSNFFILSNKIKMRLDLKDKNHQKLIDLIDKIEIILEPENIVNHNQDSVEVHLKEIVVIARNIFNKEWDISKKIFQI
jgi:hypothetical protein